MEHHSRTTIDDLLRLRTVQEVRITAVVVHPTIAKTVIENASGVTDATEKSWEVCPLQF